MKHPSLDLLATQLATHLDCTQDPVCRQIVRELAATGKPLAPGDLASCLQISLESLAAHLAHVSDTEFDHEGKIVGWGLTLVPTSHQFRVKGQALFTWCAFDTVLFPSLVPARAQVRSTCQTTGQQITFRATAEGITDLAPVTSVLSLTLPSARCECVRGTFCAQSHFFQTKDAAEPWM